MLAITHFEFFSGNFMATRNVTKEQPPLLAPRNLTDVKSLALAMSKNRI